MTELRERLQATLGDSYTLERELGGGGMSRVFVADETALGRKVVVKVLPPDLAAGVSVDRFKREIQMAARLQHPHIVPVLSAGETHGLPYYTMPFVTGSSLRARLAEGPFSIAEAVGVLKEVARALAYAHEQGVVHRDIKPDNVLLTGGSAVVTDFGIAKALSASRMDSSGSATLTALGTSLGTPAYMAPEQGAGDPGTDHRADLYSFGCMAYELLCGEQPFHGRTPHKLMAAHMGEKPRPIAERRLDTPPALAELVMQCLEKEPELRPRSAADVARVLDSVTSSGTTPSAPAILAGRINVGKALGVWAAGAALIVLTAWAATVVIGLPDWVLPGSIGVMLAGLPIIGFTAWVQRTAHRAYTATPTFTPGGSSTTQGTLHTIAIKASPHVSWRRTWMGGAIAVGAFVVLVVGFMVMRALGIGPAGSLVGAGKLGAGDQIILVDFASPAADSTLGLTVTEALRADLVQSTLFRVFPRLATIEALRRMQRPPNSRVDFDLARTVATREGLKAVLDGDIVTLGGRYILTTRLMTASGDQLATFSEEAASESDLIPAIGKLGKQIRAKAGESLKEVREAGALERVTTGSLEALRKYTAANVAFDQTADYTRAIPLLQEAVKIDSTFAMAWRRLGSYYNNTQRFEQATAAAAQAYKYSDRLGEAERQLTIAGYYTYGPQRDDEKALAAYEALISLDSLNSVALNNGAVLLQRRRESEKALGYYMRSASLPGRTPLSFQNAIGAAAILHRWELVDSLQREALRAYPTNPLILALPSRLAASRGDFDRAAQLSAEVLPRLATSRTQMIGQRGFDASLAMTRGKVREGFKFRTEQREGQMQAGSRRAELDAALDSAGVFAVLLEDRPRAKAILERGLKRTPLDSIPYLDRDYDFYIAVATQVGDTARVREWVAEDHKGWEKFGKTFDRPGFEALADANLAMAYGRYAEALENVRRAERANFFRADLVAATRFLVLNRLQMPDSTIAAGEAYLTIVSAGKPNLDQLYLAGVRQRLGELYEARGEFDKALTHYQAFVELWKDSDPELQPRVRDVRARVERIQRRRG